MTPTAISHQIRQLEAELGLALFERRNRQVVPTAAARMLLPALTTAFDGMAGAVAAVTRRPARQVATLSATVAFTARLLVPHAGGFRKLHPEWDLRLHAADEPVDLAGGEADAAIRYGRGDYPGLATLPLVRDRIAPVASPHLGLTDPGDLATATLLHFEWPTGTPKACDPTWREWGARAGIDLGDAAGGITFNDEGSVIQAALAGHGVALLSLVLVDAELRSGALVQPFGPVLDGQRFDLVYPERAEARRSVVVLREWLAAALGDLTTTGGA
ncbi:Glycine cleavage system transcriptional activator [Methylobrevis pamukkalensis]|uniref:Glycine cleavage system transcriptional activator n=1 Tax=Methylobrevis pamukkalensis TaxID=1439726 RepID=A0A1E3H5A7_9HYPH|nr:LysR substrate-binding domain-containing protein [Methylobrevis pamukkalensis]ODN70976.1 Glycine cleavage system transcriptional activator [Methylobrevis pamukkalensis]